MKAARVVAAGLAAGVAAGLGWYLADDHRRRRLGRSVRVWRLAARRGVALADTRLRVARADEGDRADIETRYAIRSAQDVAEVLGDMKGALMKIGQLASVLADGLPPEAQSALSALQADAPPMAPGLAAEVVEAELGAPPERAFARWDPDPVAAASIGQVHRAWDQRGRALAVKVQYPGAGEAITADLDNAEALYGLVSAVALRGFDSRAMVDELRARMIEELDYTREAANQMTFARRWAGHPSVRVPGVVPELSARRVLVTEWAEGMAWDRFEAGADPGARHRAAETIFRFVQASVMRDREFNGDPHPGNYRFGADGTVTFLDFGMVKRWTPGEWERLAPCLDAVLGDDPDATTAAMEGAGFLAPDHGLDPAAVHRYVSAPYVPYATPTFTFTRAFVGEALAGMFDVSGPQGAVIRALNLPPSFVILNRLVWGVSALMGRLEASGPWRGILAEYRQGAPPATALGEAEAVWRAGLSRPSGR